VKRSVSRDGLQLVILTGLSGSGKSTVLKTFEDLGYYCVDNLPVELIPTFSELHVYGNAEIERAALLVDAREGDQLKRLPEIYKLIRREVAATLVPGLRITRYIEDALRGTDVIMLLRVQKERLAGQKIRLQDYIGRYQMTTARLKLAKRDAIVMHPGPIIRGLELTAEVADGPHSVIVDEVHNGVPTRMAILARALGKGK